MKRVNVLGIHIFDLDIVTGRPKVFVYRTPKSRPRHLDRSITPDQYRRIVDAVMDIVEEEKT
jgi:hypothetical protein